MPIMYEKMMPKVEPLEMMGNPMANMHPGAQMISHMLPNSHSPQHQPQQQQQQQLQQHFNSGSPTLPHMTSISPNDSPLSMNGQVRLVLIHRSKLCGGEQ